MGIEKRVLSAAWEETLRQTLGVSVKIEINDNDDVYTSVAGKKQFVMHIGLKKAKTIFQGAGYNDETIQSLYFYHEYGHLYFMSFPFTDYLKKAYSGVYEKPEDVSKYVQVIDDLFIDTHWSRIFPVYARKIESEYDTIIMKRKEKIAEMIKKLNKGNFWVLLLFMGYDKIISSRKKSLVDYLNKNLSPQDIAMIDKIRILTPWFYSDMSDSPVSTYRIREEGFRNVMDFYKTLPEPPVRKQTVAIGLGGKTQAKKGDEQEGGDEDEPKATLGGEDDNGDSCPQEQESDGEGGEEGSGSGEGDDEEDDDEDSEDTVRGMEEEHSEEQDEDENENGKRSGSSSSVDDAGDGDSGGEGKNIEIVDGEEEYTELPLEADFKDTDLMKALKELGNIKPNNRALLQYEFIRRGVSFMKDLKKALEEGKRASENVAFNSGVGSINTKAYIRGKLSGQYKKIFNKKVLNGYQGSKWLFIVDVSGSTLTYGKERVMPTIDGELEVVQSFLNILPSSVYADVIVFSSYFYVIKNVTRYNMIHKVTENIDFGGTNWGAKLVSTMQKYAQDNFQIVIMTDGDISIEEMAAQKFLSSYRAFRFKPIIFLFATGIGSNLIETLHLKKGEDYGMVSLDEKTLDADTLKYVRQIAVNMR